MVTVKRKYKKSKRQKEKEKEKRRIERLEKRRRLREREKIKEKNARERRKRNKLAMRRRRKEERKRAAALLRKEIAKNKDNYKMVLCKNGKQSECIGVYRTIEEAYDRFNGFKNGLPKVIYPKRIVNSHGHNDVVFECVLLEKSNGVEKEALLRNEYGKFVKHTTTSDKWNIIDKFQYEVEETFWVFGYAPKSDRKTFSWIYDNILSIKEDSTELLMVFLYGNKIVVKDDNGNLDLIITKNRDEGVRFYNTVIEQNKTHKGSDRMLLMGSVGGKSDYTVRLVSEIQEVTGWTRKKIMRMTTSPD